MYETISKQPKTMSKLSNSMSLLPLRTCKVIITKNDATYRISCLTLGYTDLQKFSVPWKDQIFSIKEDDFFLSLLQKSINILIIIGN